MEKIEKIGVPSHPPCGGSRLGGVSPNSRGSMDPHWGGVEISLTIRAHAGTIRKHQGQCGDNQGPSGSMWGTIRDHVGIMWAPSGTM